MVKLWRFEWESNYGNLTGLFKATDEDVKNAIGREVWFGEVEGKHSDIYGTLDSGDIMLESDNPIVVDGIDSIGLNPLEHLMEKEDDTVYIFGKTAFATYEEAEKRAIELEESEPKWYEY